MQQRDIILDQVEQAGKILAQLLSKFHLLEGTCTLESIHTFGEELKEQLDIDLEELLELEEGKLKQYFEKRFFASKHIYLLAKQLAASAASLKEQVISDRYLFKAIQLMRLSEEMSETFSIERQQEIQTLLKKRKI